MAAKEVPSDKEKYIRWFSELNKDDVKQVGGKSANLGEMYNIGMPVPPGFTTTADSYVYFLEQTKLGDKIYEMLNKIDVENTAELEGVSREIQDMIISSEIPEDMEKEIIEAYEILSAGEIDMQSAGDIARQILKKGKEPVFVAVRSSATAEDTERASFAGQQETYLNVKGNESLILSIKKCFASLFTSRSIYYRVKKGFKHEEVYIAVIVQIMINSDKSGVIFTKDPVELADNIVIEAVFGLGEGIVSGRIKPDHYVVSRDMKILSKSVSDKKTALTRDSAGNTIEVKLIPEKSKSQVLTDSEIKKLADYSLELEEHYQLGQDIEFAIDSGKIFIVQTRPITTLKGKKKEIEVKGKELISGQPASPGVGSGIVKVIHDLRDLNKIVKGDVLVTKMTNPDMVVTMQKCAAIVTDEGGATAHAAIVSREMGLPAVVGTINATKVLEDGVTVTVNGFNGKVYEGAAESVEVEIRPIVETKTKIKVIVDLPSFAERASRTGCKSIGLTRIEGIIAESGKHPFRFMEEKKMKDYEEIIFNGINKIAEYFDEIWIRTSDIRSDEFRNLEGSPKQVETNPMLGMHGIRAGLKYPEILKSELLAIKKLADKGKKIGVMMPQIISSQEVRQVRELLEELKINNILLGVMVETPAACQIIEQLCNQGISFISFGTNDLTQYTLAIDRGNEKVQYLYNEMHPAVLRQLSEVIKVCKSNNVETSICGQAGSDKDMVRFLVKHGIDSISVNADKAFEISELVRELEGKDLKVSELGKVMKKQEEKAREKTAKEKTAEEKKEEAKTKEAVEDVKELLKEAVEQSQEQAQPTEQPAEQPREEFNVNLGIDIFSQQGAQVPEAEKPQEQPQEQTQPTEQPAEIVEQPVEQPVEEKVEEKQEEKKEEKKEKKPEDIFSL